MVTEGIKKVRVLHNFEVGPSSLKYVSETLGLWSSEVFAALCSLTRGQSDPHLSAGRGLGEAAPVLLVDGRRGTTGEKLQENGRSWEHGVTGQGYISGNFGWT